MRQLLLIAAGICLFGALWKKEAEEDGLAVALSPLLAALAFEAAAMLLRRERAPI
jgi:hypothetical protein